MSPPGYTRRDFLKTTGAGAVSLAVTGCANNDESPETQQMLTQAAIPRWRGFNMMEFFTPFENKESTGVASEDDFRWISDWGFDFIRLPMAYPRWIEFDRSKPITKDDVYNIKESTLEQIDRMVDLAQKYQLHINLNFHRGPGYCVNSGFEEPFDLWKDQDAFDAFCFHWSMFARRYQDIPSTKISFNLINEPPAPNEDGLTSIYYKHLVNAATAKILEANSNHLVIADGLRWGSEPVPNLIDLGIAQSCHGYDPHAISHYRARWVDSGDFPEPVWPGVEFRGEYWDRRRLEHLYAPWIDLARQGIGVHCGECGCYNKTPHKVFLAWFRDVLDILTDAGIGYSLWNFRHEYGFGILDSGREDIEYEDWYGHKLDRKLLDLLLEF